MLRWVRFGGGYAWETLDRPRDEGEDDRLAARLDVLHVPIERLDDARAFLSAFEAKRYRFRAVFGESGDAPFQAVKIIVGRIRGAVEIEAQLARRDHRFGRGRPGGRPGMDPDPDLDKVIFNRGRSDEIDVELDAIVTALEALCRPAIEARARITAGR